MEALYRYKATVTQVIDGDTFRLLTDLGFHIFHKTYARVRNFDAPEIRRYSGVTAEQVMAGMFHLRGVTANAALPQVALPDPPIKYLLRLLC